MKKHLLLSLFAASSIVGSLSAQSLTPAFQELYDYEEIRFGRELSIIPKAFTTNGQLECWSYEYDAEKETVSLLDNDFQEKGKTISVNTETLTGYTVYKERERVISSSPTHTDTIGRYSKERIQRYLGYNEDNLLTTEDIKKFIEEDRYFSVKWIYTEPGTGYTVFLNVTEGNYEEYTSTTLTRRGYIWNGSILSGINYYYDALYTGEWTERKENNSAENIYDRMCVLYYCDMDENSFTDEYFYLTQNLFNTDDKYEYLVFSYELVESSSSENDRDGDGTIDQQTIYYYPRATKLSCLSEDGHTLWQVDINGSESCNVYRINGKYYIKIGGIFYLIDKESTGLQTVQNTAAMKVFPTLASPSDAITIELNAEGGDASRHLYISDAAGRIVDSRIVEAGKNSVSIDAGRFRSGMYNFTLEENGRVVDNGKILVR